MNRLRIYLWPTASTTSGGAGRTVLSVRSSIVSVFGSRTVRFADCQKVTMTLSFARCSVDFDTLPASSAYSIPQTDHRAHASGSIFNPPSTKSSSTCTKSLEMSGSSLKLSRTQCTVVRRKLHYEEEATQYTSLPQSLSDVMPFTHSVHRHPYARELICLRGTCQ